MVTQYLTRKPRILNGKRIVSPINGVGNLENCTQKNETEPLSCKIQKINSKWLIIRPETEKLLLENLKGNLLDSSPVNNIFNLTPKAKAKIHKLDYIKLKSSCTVRKTIIKMKRQSMEREKITTKYLSQKK